MNTQLCFEIYYNKLSLFNLIENNFDQIMEMTIYFEGETPVEIKHDEKIEYFFLTRFCNKSTLFFKDLMDEIGINSANEKILKFSKIADLFLEANKEFNISLEKTLEIFTKNFKLSSNEFFEFENFMEFFKIKRKFTIKIYEFLDLSLDVIMEMYKTVENKLKEFCKNCKEMSNDCLSYKNFEEVISKLIPNFENKWKINDYFKYK